MHWMTRPWRSRPLGVIVTAEGIEIEEQRAFLRTL
jgi:EAL domain-containing protein (putative c-di-GMP-specific phosphodiesterase class I)